MYSTKDKIQILGGFQGGFFFDSQGYVDNPALFISYPISTSVCNGFCWVIRLRHAIVWGMYQFQTEELELFGRLIALLLLDIIVLLGKFFDNHC